MVWMQNFKFSHKFVAMVWCPLSTKGQGALEHKMVNLWEKISWWVKFSKNWLNKKVRLAPRMVEGAQNLLAQIGSHGVLSIPSTANVWCTRCKLKVLIASQVGLNWWGRPLKWMTGKKHVSNDQWKPWHAHSNIQVSSNSLPSTQRPWRHTHYGGMGELFEKCWLTTQSTTPLLIIIPHCSEGG
jgi:hypothetical protein